MPEWVAFLVGLVLTVTLGEGVGRLLDKAFGKKPDPPTAINAAMWDAMYDNPTGRWIGRPERVLMFAVIWKEAYLLLIGGWLVFKLGAKWETWRNVIQVPESLVNIPQSEWWLARLRYGNWLYSRFLVGTLANLLLAAAGVYTGKHLWNVVAWVCSSQGHAYPPL